MADVCSPAYLVRCVGVWREYAKQEPAAQRNVRRYRDRWPTPDPQAEAVKAEAARQEAVSEKAFKTRAAEVEGAQQLVNAAMARR